jgi:hypothetical protein
VTRTFRDWTRSRNNTRSAAAGVCQPPPLLAILAKRKTLPRCDVCAKDFTSQAQLEEHRKGKAHWRAARDAKAAAHGHTVPTKLGPSSDGRKKRRTRWTFGSLCSGTRKRKAPGRPALRVVPEDVHVGGAARRARRRQMAQDARRGDARAEHEAVRVAVRVRGVTRGVT